VSRFFYCVIVPKDVVKTKIVTGRLLKQNTFEALKSVSKIHPNAIKVIVRKEKSLELV
jgi:hypothetical protein